MQLLHMLRIIIVKIVMLKQKDSTKAGTNEYMR